MSMSEEFIPLKRNGHRYVSHCLHFGKQMDRGWVSEGSPEGGGFFWFFFPWWLCRQPGTPALGSMLHGREVLFTKERPLCSRLLYSLDWKKITFFFPKFLDLPLSWFWTTISTVEFWTPVWAIRVTLESSVILFSALLKTLLGYFKNIKVSAWNCCI